MSIYDHIIGNILSTVCNIKYLYVKVVGNYFYPENIN